jgi:hypothetical protein
MNMAPVLPFVLGYVFWQHGLRAGLWATLGGALAFIGGHGLFWPGIMRLWAEYLPWQWRPWLTAGQTSAGLGEGVTGNISLGGRVISFLEGFRFHFVAFVGALLSWLLWPKTWESRRRFKAAVFLTGLFGLLLLLHAWASLGQNYCVSCFAIYASFFSVLGIFLAALSYPEWRLRLPRILAVILVVLIAVGVSYGYAMYTNRMERLVAIRDVIKLIRTEVPRFKGGRITEGTIPLWGLIGNRYNLTYEEVFDVVYRGLNLWARRLRAILYALLVSLGLLLASNLIKRFFARRGGDAIPRFEAPTLGLVLAFLLGWILSPSEVLSGGAHLYDCGTDVISSVEAAGAHLAEAVPPGAQVYWRSGDSQVALLYVDDFKMFPPQLNDYFTYREGGDLDALEKRGYWNDELAHQWAQEADLFLIEQRAFGGWLQELLTSDDFSELAPTGPIGCREGTRLRIFLRDQGD